jgi:hypothetical protein
VGRPACSPWAMGCREWAMVVWLAVAVLGCEQMISGGRWQSAEGVAWRGARRGVDGRDEWKLSPCGRGEVSRVACPCDRAGGVWCVVCSV